MCNTQIRYANRRFCACSDQEGASEASQGQEVRNQEPRSSEWGRKMEEREGGLCFYCWRIISSLQSVGGVGKSIYHHSTSHSPTTNNPQPPPIPNTNQVQVIHLSFVLSNSYVSESIYVYDHQNMTTHPMHAVRNKCAI